jgi:hypothetical protein
MLPCLPVRALKSSFTHKFVCVMLFAALPRGLAPEPPPSAAAAAAAATAV